MASTRIIEHDFQNEAEVSNRAHAWKMRHNEENSYLGAANDSNCDVLTCRASDMQSRVVSWDLTLCFVESGKPSFLTMKTHEPSFTLLRSCLSTYVVEPEITSRLEQLSWHSFQNTSVLDTILIWKKKDISGCPRLNYCRVRLHVTKCY